MDNEGCRLLLAEISAKIQASQIETERLRLRCYRASDFPDYCELALQKEQQRLSGNAAINTEAEARELFENWYLAGEDRPPTSFAVELKAERRVVGSFTIGAHPRVMEHPDTAGLRGVCLSCTLNENYWRQGIMKELFRAVIPWLFETAGLDFVNAGYFDFNVASKRLQESVGFRPWISYDFDLFGETVIVHEGILFRNE